MPGNIKNFTNSKMYKNNYHRYVGEIVWVKNDKTIDESIDSADILNKPLKLGYRD